MSPRGRPATLPAPGSGTARGLLNSDGALLVRVFAQDGSAYRDYGFETLEVAEGIRFGLATAFARRTAPGAGFTRLPSATSTYRSVVQFSRYLAQLAWPPTEMAHLMPEHLDGFYKHRRESVTKASQELANVKLLLAHADGLKDALVGKMKEANPRLPLSEAPKESFSRAEFKRIVDAARSDLRLAAQRIRHNRGLLDGYRQGDLTGEASRRMELLDWVDRFGDVPRRPTASGPNAGAERVRDWVSEHGTVDEIVSWLHLSGLEVTAGAVLLTALTGQNPGVVLATQAAHHRADGHTGATATAILPARKPRRGRRAHLTLVLSQIPDWITIPADVDELSARDELHTPFGVYALLHELAARSRGLIGSDRLLVGWSGKGGGTAGRGLRTQGTDGWVRKWTLGHGLTADKATSEGKSVPLRMTLDLIRLTYLELYQKPVAHTEQTLATDYLTRNRGNLAEYQRVVAAALAGEVDKARVRGVMAVLSKADVERAQVDADAVAAEYRVDPVTLSRMIAGELDTVMNACSDNENSPHAPAGEPCQASFMLCLGCPCARALPRHLPVQALVHDRLEARRDELTPLQWTQRFALPHAQLGDLLGQHEELDVEDARANATDVDRALVARFLNRELDLR